MFTRERNKVFNITRSDLFVLNVALFAIKTDNYLGFPSSH